MKLEKPWSALVMELPFKQQQPTKPEASGAAGSSGGVDRGAEQGGQEGRNNIVDCRMYIFQ